VSSSHKSRRKTGSGRGVNPAHGRSERYDPSETPLIMQAFKHGATAAIKKLDHIPILEKEGNREAFYSIARELAGNVSVANYSFKFVRRDKKDASLRKKRVEEAERRAEAEFKILGIPEGDIEEVLNIIFYEAAIFTMASGK